MPADFERSIHKITSREPGNPTIGTGFVIHRQGGAAYLLTCRHVLEDAGGAASALAANLPVKRAIPPPADLPVDLAVLEVEGLLDAPPLRLAAPGRIGAGVTVSGFHKFVTRKTYRIQSIDGFDDGDLRAFLAGKDVKSIDRQFFIRNETPYWSVIVVYEDDFQAPAAPFNEKTGGKGDYRKYLNAENTPLFNLLRDWRRERAMKIGKPPFVVFNNMQLATITARKPDSLQGLAAIEGVGPTKLEKYGKEVLAIW